MCALAWLALGLGCKSESRTDTAPPAATEPTPGNDAPAAAIQAAPTARAQPAEAPPSDAREAPTPPADDARRDPPAVATPVEPAKPRAARPVQPAIKPKPSPPSAPTAVQGPAPKPRRRSEPPPEPPAPEPVTQRVEPPAPRPEPEKPKTRVQVPRTAHVHAALPAALQALLDDDPRMQPWVNRVISVADACYVKNNGRGMASAGTITATVTMHENARPDVDIDSLPPQLSSVVACATGDLMRNRMPLFTSAEGERHRVSLHFE